MLLQLFRRCGLFIEPALFSPAECELLCQEALRSPDQTAATIYEGAEGALDEKTRRNKVVKISGASHGKLMDAFSRIRPRLEEHFQTPLSAFDPPQVLLYREGDHFVPHRDTPKDAECSEEVRRRKVSAILFLNDRSAEPLPNTFDGGALTFYGILPDPRGEEVGLPLPAAAGLLVAFRSQTIHGVEPVARGHRVTVVTFYS